MSGFNQGHTEDKFLKDYNLLKIENTNFPLANSIIF